MPETSTKGGRCSCCGKPLGKASLRYSVGGGIYCYDCFQKVSEQAREQEEKQQQLYSYIKDLFHVKEIPENVISAIERLVGKGKTFNGIKKTLYYYYQISGNGPTDITRFRYVTEEYYESAKKYFIKRAEINKINKDFVDNSQSRTIKINPKELFKKAQTKSKIDIGDL